MGEPAVPIATPKRNSNLRLEDLKVPSLSTVVLEVIRLASAPNVGVRELSSAIQRDPGLSSRVLQLANSAFFNQGSSVSTIDRALVLIGLNTMRSVVLGVSIVDAVDRHGRVHRQLQEFWRDSLLRACVGRELARFAHPELAPEAYLVGLLQDLGIPILLESDPGYVDTLQASAGCRARLHALEIESGALNHSEVIQYLCREWNLPEVLATPLADHHSRPPSNPTTDQVTALTQIAYIAGSLPIGAKGVEELGDAELGLFIRTSMKCDAQQFDEVLESAAKAFEALRQPFGKLLPPKCDAAAAVDVARQLVNVAQERSRWLSDLDVLVLDTSKVQRNIVARMLRAIGTSSIEMAGTGEDAIELCKKQPPDVVLTSFHLHDMTAAELREQLRQLPGLSELKVLVLSSRDPLEDESLDDGQVAMLQKPFKPAALKQSLSELCRPTDTPE